MSYGTAFLIFTYPHPPPTSLSLYSLQTPCIDYIWHEGLPFQYQNPGTGLPTGPVSMLYPTPALGAPVWLLPASPYLRQASCLSPNHRTLPRKLRKTAPGSILGFIARKHFPLHPQTALFPSETTSHTILRFSGSKASKPPPNLIKLLFKGTLGPFLHHSLTSPQNTCVQGHVQNTCSTVSSCPHPTGHRGVLAHPKRYRRSLTGRRPKAPNQFRSLASPSKKAGWRASQLTSRPTMDRVEGTLWFCMNRS